MMFTFSTGGIVKTFSLSYNLYLEGCILFPSLIDKSVKEFLTVYYFATPYIKLGKKNESLT